MLFSTNIVLSYSLYCCHCCIHDHASRQEVVGMLRSKPCSWTWSCRHAFFYKYCSQLFLILLPLLYDHASRQQVVGMLRSTHNHAPEHKVVSMLLNIKLQACFTLLLWQIDSAIYAKHDHTLRQQVVGMLHSTWSCRHAFFYKYCPQLFLVLLPLLYDHASRQQAVGMLRSTWSCRHAFFYKYCPQLFLVLLLLFYDHASK
jgi:hypothetical protein